MAESLSVMETTVEPDLENRLLEIVGNSRAGVTTIGLQNTIPINVDRLVKALNNLIAQNQIELFTQDTQLLYKIKNPESAKIFQGSDIEEKLVYQIIEKAGNKGIWIRDLRFSSNLSQTQVNKILKNLENKKLIKSVKSVAASKKKVYMLYNIEPDRTVTGGTWYSDQEFESEFVDVLNQQCYRYLQHAKISADKYPDPISQRNASCKSSDNICNYINGLKVSKVQLSIQDIETILDTLIYDGKVEKIPFINSISNEKETNYCVTKPYILSCGLMRMPCGVCLIFDSCHEGGDISPSTCHYMKEWLDF